MVTATATEASPMQRIQYEGRCFQMTYAEMAEVFGILGKAVRPCELGACGHVELVPSGLPGGYKQRCIYEPQGLVWLADSGNDFVPQTGRCAALDRKLAEYTKAGMFDEYEVPNLDSAVN